MSDCVTIFDMMQCRERRAAVQKQFRLQYHSAVICFCMNIPGPIKTKATIRYAFDVGADRLLQTLKENHIVLFAQCMYHEKTGDELLLCADADAHTLKNLCSTIEEEHPLGRLFDMDVLDVNGEKCSRPRYRKCLLCDQQAQVCARTRAHDVDVLWTRINQMIEDYKPNL